MSAFRGNEPLDRRIQRDGAVAERHRRQASRPPLLAEWLAVLNVIVLVSAVTIELALASLPADERKDYKVETIVPKYIGVRRDAKLTPTWTKKTAAEGAKKGGVVTMISASEPPALLSFVNSSSLVFSGRVTEGLLEFGHDIQVIKTFVSFVLPNR